MVLASGSPRRYDLLYALGLTFTIVLPPDDAEPTPLPDESPASYALRAACVKAYSLLPTLYGQEAFLLQRQQVQALLTPSFPLPSLVPKAMHEPINYSLPHLPTLKHAILAADTVVALGTTVFGKPKNKADALYMLKSLVGKTHTVYTGYSLITPMGNDNKSIATQVTFGDSSEKILRNYIETGEPFDKAGSYAIQGKGAFLIHKINGSYTNIVGLPLAEVVQSLLKLTIIT